MRPALPHGQPIPGHELSRDPLSLQGIHKLIPSLPAPTITDHLQETGSGYASIVSWPKAPEIDVAFWHAA